MSVRPPTANPPPGQTPTAKVRPGDVQTASPRNASPAKTQPAPRSPVVSGNPAVSLAPMLEAVQRGLLVPQWKQVGEERRLVLVRQRPDAAPELPEAQLATGAALLVQRLEGLPEALRQAWDGDEQVLAAWVQANGLAPLWGDWVMNSPAYQETLAELWHRSHLAREPEEALRQRCARVGLGEAAFNAWKPVMAAELAHVDVLDQVHPIPEAWRAPQVSPRAPVSLPLDEAPAQLSDEQQQSLAALQRYFVLTGQLQPGKFQPGARDAPTLEALRSLAPESATQLELSNATLHTLFRALADRLDLRRQPLFEQVALHPAVRRHWESQGKPPVDPFQLVWAYLDERAGAKKLPSHGLTPDTLAALDASLHAPLDEAALERAEQRVAREGPWPEAVRSALWRSEVALLRVGDRLSLFPLGEGDGSSLELEGALAAWGAPATSRRVGRTTQGLLSWTPLQPGLDRLAEVEPIATLRLLLAFQRGEPPPINGQGQMDGHLSARELRQVAGVLAPKFSPEAKESWKQVIQAVSLGKVVLTSLRPLGEAPGLVHDLNVVLAGLKDVLEGVRDRSEPVTTGGRALKDDRLQFRPIAGSDYPLRDAKAVLERARLPGPADRGELDDAPPVPAGGGDAAVASGELSLEDLRRVERFVRNLPQLFPPERQDDAARLGREVAKELAEAKPAWLQVRDALEKGQLQLSDRRTKAREELQPALDRVLPLVLKAAEALQAGAASENDTRWGPIGNRVWLALRHSVGHLPLFTSPRPLDAVDDAHLMALKEELGRLPELEPQLRQALYELNADSVGFLAAKESDAKAKAELETLAAALKRGELKPWTPGLGRDGLSAPQRTAEEALARLHRDAVGKARRFEPALVEHLVQRYPEAFGKSLVQGVATSGATSAEPWTGEVVEKLGALAKQLPPEGWSSLHVAAFTPQSAEPPDDKPTREAKHQVQAALRRLYGTVPTQLVGQSISGSPTRELSEAASTFTASTGLGIPAGAQSARGLKALLVELGFVRPAELGPLWDTTFGPEALQAAALLARRTAALVKRRREPERAATLEQAAATLTAAARSGQAARYPVFVPKDPVAKALQQLGESALARAPELTYASNERAFDLGEWLPSVAELTVRSAPENIVSTGATQVALWEGHAPSMAPTPAEPRGASEQARRSLSGGIELSPETAAESAVDTAVLFKSGLMAAQVRAALAIKAPLDLLTSGVAHATAQTEFEKREAYQKTERAAEEVATVLGGLSAFLFPVEDVANDLVSGHWGHGLGKAAGYAVAIPLAKRLSKLLFRTLSKGPSLAVAPLVVGELVDWALDATGSRVRPEEQVAHWQQLGIPEFRFLKLPPQLPHQGRSGVADTPRTRLWLSSGSPLYERLKQLNGGVPLRFSQPQALDLSRCKAFTEPVYPALTFLRGLGTLRQSDARLRTSPAAMGFDSAAWEAQVRQRIAGLVSQTAPAPGSASGRAALALDLEALDRLLRDEGSLESLPSAAEQGSLLDEMDWLQAASGWTQVLNRLPLELPEKERLAHTRAQLEAYLLNLAANARAGAVLRGVGSSLELPRSPWDAYLGAGQFLSGGRGARGS